MWPFGKTKKKQRDRENEFPVVFERPITCYVHRITPKEVEGFTTSGRAGTHREVMALDEMEEAVRQQFGGGTYRARVYDGKKYLGLHNFELQGESLIDGKPIEPKPKSKKDKKPGPVSELEEEGLVVDARTKLMEKRAKQKEIQEALGAGTGSASQADDFEERLAEQQQVFEQRIEEMADRQKEESRERESKEREHQLLEEMKRQREETDRRFADVLKTIQDKDKEGAQSSNVQVLMSAMQTQSQAQMETMRQVTEGIREQSNTLIGHLSQPSPAQQEATLAREQLMQVLQNQIQQIQGNDHTNFETFMQFFFTLRSLVQQDVVGASGSPGGSVWADAAKDIASSISSALTTLGKQTPGNRGLPAPDSNQITMLAKERAQEAIDKAGQETKRRLEDLRTQRSASDLPKDTPVSRTQETPPAKETTIEEDIKARRSIVVDELMKILLVEMHEQPEEPSWPHYAVANLPKEIVEAFLGVNSPAGFRKVIELLSQYGEEKQVQALVSAVETDVNILLWLAKGIAQLQDISVTA